MRLIRFRPLAALAIACLVVTAFVRTAAAQSTDTDGDTLPDAWETFFGLDPNDAADAAGDPDGDGLTNVQEYGAGRHPLGRFARFFAEGSTGYFDTSLAVLNLSTTETAHVSIALLNESGGVTTHQVTLAPRARQSVALNTVLGTAAAVSIIVESDVAIAADRVMTWGPGGLGMSLDSGAPAPSTTWYFAEGATGQFLVYYLFENPGATPATVTVRYLREGDTPITRTRALPPHSRTTVFVNDDDPGLANASFGAIVTADQPILAERSMYLQANGTFAGGSASSGQPALSTVYYFGEGATGPFFHAFLSMMNPLPSPATALVTYHLSDGTTASKSYAVPSGGRRTIYFNDEAGTDPALAALASGPVWFSINSSGLIAAERAMWWSTWPWYEGHAATGSITSELAWGVAEGRHGGPANDQTYVLVGNPFMTPARVRVTLIPDTGAPSSRDLDLAAGGRLTLDVGSLFGLTGESRFSVTVESIGASPLPIAVDYARYRSVNGVPFSGGGAAPAVPLQLADAAPSVTATTPALGATGASSTNNLSVTFNEPVEAAAGAFTLACPAGTPIALTVVTASPASAFTLDPNVPLPPSTTCTLTVQASAVTDVDSTDPPDVMTANAVVTFTTAAESAPTVSSTTPSAGAAQVGLAANVTITFSEPVDVTGSWFEIVCATSGTRTVANAVVSGGPTAFTIDPSSDFVAGEACTVTVFAAQVADQDPLDPPDTMAANYFGSFTIDAPPAVTATTPANGATQVATTAAVSVTFSEPVDVTGSWFSITCSVSGAHTATATGGPAVHLLTPDVAFSSGDLCTVTIAAALVADQDAIDPPDGLAANHVFSFMVDTAPSVTATTPANGATGVAAAANITVTFDESVNASAASFALVCGGSPQAFAVSASPAAVFTLNPTADLPAGVFCTVTVVAAQVGDADAGDPPDGLLADYVFSFAVPPDALNDARGATGNVPIDTAITGFSVLSNDVGPGIAVSAFDATSVRGGTVSVNGAGVFTYTPPVGYDGIDSFTYTITNPAGSDTAAVNVTVAGMLWFVDNTAPACTTIAGGCGRLGTPFSSLAAFEAVNGDGTVGGGDVIDPEAGDTIFIVRTGANYVGPLTLENSQRVIGTGAISTLATLAGITFAADSVSVPGTGGFAPIITGAGIALAQNNRLHGLGILNTAGTAIGGNNVGTLVISEHMVVENTTGTPVSLANGAITASFGAISANGAPNGIVVSNTTGSFTVTGGGSVDGTGGTIQNIATRGASFVNATNITLRNMNFVNAATADFPAAPTGLSLGVNTADNAAIHLQNASNVVLDNLNIVGSAEHGINGHNVNGFTLSNSVLANLGNGPDEDGLHFYNMVGTSAIANTTITSSGDDNVNIQNNDNLPGDLPQTTTGTIAITGGSASTGVLGSGYLLGIRGTMNTTVTVDGVTSNDNFSGGVVIDTYDTATSAIEVMNSTITNNNDAISLSSTNGSTKFDIHDNVSFAGTAFGRINVLKAAFSTAGILQGRIRNNPMVVTDGQTADGIVVFQAGGGTLRVAIANNTIDYRGTQRPILLQGGQDGAGSLHATVTGNVIDVKLDGVGDAVTGVLAQVAVASPSGDNTSMCADIGGAGALANIFTHSLGGNMAAGDMRVRQRFATTVTLPGYSGAANDNAAVAAYLIGRNSLANLPAATASNEVGVTPGAGGFVNGVCQAPVFP